MPTAPAMAPPTRPVGKAAIPLELEEDLVLVVVLLDVDVVVDPPLVIVVSLEVVEVIKAVPLDTPDEVVDSTDEMEDRAAEADPVSAARAEVMK
jgi:hypothetical protein